ncbi:MAG: universal stress protein [Thermomicrobiales bacterium]|nr:universal stress protein [Thermomicrobiales bacterium]
MVFGSVADKIVRGSTVPVVLVRDEHEQPHDVLRTVLVPLDGSALSETALPYAVELAQGTGATLALVRVVEPYWQSAFIAETPEAVYLSQSQIDDLEEQAHAEARGDLDTLATRLRGEGLRVVWEVRTGRPADEIARVAETTDADLIVISTHGRGGIRRWAFGSVTNEVLHRSKTPVLAIPPRAHVREAKQTQPSALAS